MTLPTVEDELGSARPSLDERTARRIKIGARFGVWGFIAALAVPALGAAGMPLSSVLGGVVMLGGIIASGLGIITAAANVWRALPSGWSLLKVASVTAIPVGLSMAFFGLSAVLPFPRWSRVLVRFSALGAAFGLVVLVLLVAAFVVSFLRTPGEED
jgi:hypothetical protein